MSRLNITTHEVGTWQSILGESSAPVEYHGAQVVPSKDHGNCPGSSKPNESFTSGTRVVPSRGQELHSDCLLA